MAWVGSVLFISIMLHELAHLGVGMLFDAKMKVFSIGFGDPIFSWQMGDIKYQLAPWLFGGYVRFESFDSDKFLYVSSFAKSILILMVGSLTNMGLWLAFRKSKHTYWGPFGRANGELAAVNLLLPLGFTDGGKIMMSSSINLLNYDPPGYVIGALTSLSLFCYLTWSFDIVKRFKEGRRKRKERREKTIKDLVDIYLNYIDIAKEWGGHTELLKNFTTKESKGIDLKPELLALNTALLQKIVEAKGARDHKSASQYLDCMKVIDEKYPGIPIESESN